MNKLRENLQEVDGNETIRDIFGGMGQEAKTLFANIENEFNNAGLDAWVSRTVSTPNRIVVMGGFLGDSMQDLHVEEIMKRNGYAQTRTGSDYVMFEKQTAMQESGENRRITIKESELSKVIAENIKKYITNKVLMNESQLRGYVTNLVRKALMEDIDMGQVPSAQDRADQIASRRSKEATPEARQLYQRIQNIRKNFDAIDKFGSDVSEAVENKLHELIAQYREMTGTD